jgi:hypothetical protein
MNPERIREAATRIAADIRTTPLWRLPGAALGLRSLRARRGDCRQAG